MGITAAISIGASAVNSAINQLAEGDYAKKRGDYLEAVYDKNAGFADSQAEDAIARGFETEFRRRAETRQQVGSQRASLAGQGIDVNYGSALATQMDARDIGEVDVATIRNNARREAWGYKVEAYNYREQGRLARLDGKMAQRNSRISSFNTLLTGGAQSYYAYRNG